MLIWRPHTRLEVTVGYVAGPRGVQYALAKLYDEWRNPRIPSTVKTRHLRYCIELTWPAPVGRDNIYKSDSAEDCKVWAASRVKELHTVLNYVYAKQN